jgi:hypothetical protein
MRKTLRRLSSENNPTNQILTPQTPTAQSVSTADMGMCDFGAVANALGPVQPAPESMLGYHVWRTDFGKNIKESGGVYLPPANKESLCFPDPRR